MAQEDLDQKLIADRKQTTDTPNTPIQIVVFDMHGIIYRYSRQPGVRLVQTITPEQSIESLSVLEEAHKTFDCLYQLDSHNGNDSLKLEEIITKQILYGQADGASLPWGIKINQRGIRLLLQACERKEYKPLIVANSRIGQTKAVLKAAAQKSYETMGRYAAGHAESMANRSASGSWVSICNMTEFGSKKDDTAWRDVFYNFVVAPYRDLPVTARITAIYEDNAKNAYAAQKAAADLECGVPAVFTQIESKTKLL